MAMLLGTASAQVTLDVSQFMAAAGQAEGAMNNLANAGGKGTPGFLSSLNKGALGLGTALIAPMTLGLSAAVDLEQGLANVDAALGDISDADLSVLSTGIQQIGVDSQYSAVQVAAVSEELAKAGFSTTEIIGATRATVDLAQATGTDLPTAVGAVTQAMSVWQDGIVDTSIALTDASRVADIYTVAANNSSASVQDIAVGMRSLGPVAASMGISFEDSAAAIALFTNYGLTGADAGISLARGIQELSNPSSAASAAMAELGITAFDAQGQFVGFSSLFDQLNTSMAGMTDQQKIATLSLIFGAEAVDVMGLAVLTGAEAYDELTGQMDESGAAAEQSAIRMDTLGAQFGTLVEGVNTFLGSLVSGLIPGLRLLVDGANAAINALMKLPEAVKTVVGAVAGLLAVYAGITRAVQAFRLVNGLVSTMSAGTVVANATSRGLLATVLRFVPALALVGAGFLIWQHNMFDVQGKFKAFVGGIKRFGKSFTDSFNNLTDSVYEWHGGVTSVMTSAGMKKLPAFFLALGNAIATIGGPGGLPILRDIGGFLMDTGTNILHLTEAFDHFRGMGLDPVQAGLRAMGVMFPEISGLMDDMQIIVGQVTEGFRSFLAGDFQAGLVSIGAAAQTAFGALSDFAGVALDWTLDVAVPTITGWLADVAGDVWAGLTAAAGFAWDGLVRLGSVTISIAGWVFSAAIDVATDLMTWIRDNGLDVAQDIGNVAVTVGAIIWNATADIFGGFVTWVSQSIALEDFGIVGDTLGEKIRSALSLAFTSGRGLGGAVGAGVAGAGQIAQWLADQINGMDFAAVGEAVGRKLTQAIALVFAGGVGFEALKASFLAGVSAAISDMDWATIGTQFWNLFTAVMTAPQEFMQGVLTGVGGAISDAVAEIDWGTIASDIGTELSSAIEGASDFAAGIGSKLNTELNQALNSIDFGSLAGTIGSKLSAAIEGVEGFATNLGGKIYNEFIQAFNGINWTLLAGSIAVGLGDGISSAVNFAASIGSKLLDEFTQAFNGIDWSGAASSIKDGLLGAVVGIGTEIGQAILDEIQAKLGDLWDWIPGTDSGQDPTLAFAGLNTGLDLVISKAREAQGALAGVFGGGGRGAAGGGGGPSAGGMVASITAIQTALTSLTTTAQTAALALGLAGLQAGQAFTTGISAGITAGVAVVANSMAIIVTVTASSMAGMAAAATTGMALVRAAVVSGITSARSAITTGMTAAVGVVRSGVASMASSMVAGMAVFRGAVTSGMAAAVSAVRSGVAAMVAAASAGRGQMMSAGLGIGAALGQGIAAGIRGQIGAVAAAAAALVSAAVGAARAAGAISSPSRVMRDEIGMNLALGVASGIYAGLPAIYRAGERMIPDVPLSAYRANAAPYGGSVITNTINTYVDANGITDPEAVAELASIRTMQAITLVMEKAR